MKKWNELVYLTINLNGPDPVFEKIIPLYLGATTEPDMPMCAVEWLFETDQSIIIDQLSESIKVPEEGTNLAWVCVLSVWECTVDDDGLIDVKYAGVMEINFNNEAI